MSARRLIRWTLAALAVAAASFSVPQARADEPGPVASGPNEPGPWEDVVFLPDSGLSVLLERDPKGVLLDRATYLDLHRRARASRGAADDAAAGPAAHLLRCDATGVVAGDQARVQVRLAVVCRGATRVDLPLRLGGSVSSATLDGAPATLSADAKGGLVLSVRGEGVHDAVVEVVAPVVRTKGLRTVQIALPPAPASRWSLEVAGRVSAKAGAGLSRAERLDAPDRTRLVAYGADAISASWHEGDQGTDLPPLVRAHLRTLAEVGERTLDAAVLVRIECSRSPADTFPLTLPADLSLVGVDGEGASVVPAGEAAAGRAPFALRFAEPFTGVRSVLLRTSRALPGAGGSTLPVIDLGGAVSVERTLAVRFKDGLRGVVDPGEGAERLDSALSDAGAVDALLRVSAGAAPQARSERPSVRLRADVRVLVHLADDGPWLAASFLYVPRGDRLYGVDPLLPAGFVPETVAVSGDRAFLRGTTPDGRLTLVFPGGVEAGGAVTVSVRGRWPAPGWGDEDAAERVAPLPRIDAGTAVECEGWIGVAVPPGTEVREEDAAGLVPAAVSELRERAGFSADGLTLGWRFRAAAPGGRLRVTRPAPSVSATVGILAVPAEDHVSFESLVVLAVQRSAIREARIRVSPAIGDLLRVEGADVAERRRVPGEGGDTWILRFGRQVRDGTAVTLRADLPVGAGPVAVPLVAVEGATREDTMVGVAAAGELDVRVEAAGLRPADAADLVPVLGPRASGLLRAWKLERGASPALSVRTTRLAASPLPSAFADSVTLTTVLGMDGIARTRLDARVRNADRQALEVTLPRGARLSSARVRGEAVRPVQTAAGALLVPIVPSASPFDVTVVYEEPAPADGGHASLEAPDLGIPGSRAVWTVHLPEGSIPVDADGDFASSRPQPPMPFGLRVFDVFAAQVKLAESDAAAPAAAPARAAGGPRAPQQPAESKPGAEVPPDTREPADAPTPAPETITDALERIEARAAQRGLFGMDIRLLAAGPSVRTVRLGPSGRVDVRWRSEAAAATTALLAALAAFAAALVARRAGIGAPTWTVVALATLTALPLVFAAADLTAWDAAAAATVVYAALALARVVWARVASLVARIVPAGLAVLLAVAIASAPARAEDAPRKAPAPEPPIPDGRVYVPYDPQRPETVRNPDRVFLPYARYVALWNAAHPEEQIRAGAPPVVVAATYEARVEDRALVLVARYEVDPLDGGVVALPPGAAVDALTLDGRPVAATAAAPGGATLVPVPRATTAGARAVLQGTLRWPVAGDLPGGSLRAPIPRAPRCTLVLDVPVADAVVQVAAAGGWATAPAGAGTRITAELGPIDALDVAWQPRGADAAGGRTRFECDSDASALIRGGMLEWASTLTVRVLAGTVHELECALPSGIEIQSVTGPAVASWTVAGGALRARLVGAGPGETKVAITGLMRLTGPSEPVLVPDPLVRGASADRSRVSVASEDSRLAVVESSGMERTDASAAGRPGAIAFRRVRTPARLTVRAEPLPAGLAVASRQHLHLGAEESALHAELDLTPGPRGLFEARIAVPAGWTLDDASGAATFPEDGAVRLVFAGAPHGVRAVVLRLRGPAARGEPLAFPLLRVGGATRETAEMLVSTAPGFAAAAEGASGIEPVPVDRFAAWPALDAAETRLLAWRDARGGGAVSLRREELRPTLQPTVVADLTVLDDRVIVDALVHWNVRGGVERTFRVDAPPGVSDAWVLGEGLRELRRERNGDRERLVVTMQAAATGPVAFRVLYEVPVPAGGAIEVTGPVPVGGDGVRSFLLLRALGESEVQIGAAPGVETCDVADLPLIPEGLDPLRVLRFLRARDAAWRLPLRLAAHELGDLPEARIHLVDATTVADRDGSARTRVGVRLFNRARSFLPVRLPSGASLESVLVGGAPVRPVTRPAEPGIVQVPVRVQSLGEESQAVTLTFRTAAVSPGEAFGSLDPRLPEFPGVPVDATTWRLFLPEGRDYAFSGNLDPVEEVEVAISRAEAYSYDNFRLRSVLSKGNRQQQAVALANLESNTRELQESLDLANARMRELSEAAAEGRVDRGRLAAGQRKAQELAREIEQTLEDVRRNKVALGDVPAQGQSLGATAMTYRAEDRDGEGAQVLVVDQERARYATREGQALKKWADNGASVAFEAGAVQADEKQADASAVRMRSADKNVNRVIGVGGDAGKRLDETRSAVAAHELFDDTVARPAGDPAAPPQSGGPATPGGGSAPAQQPGAFPSGSFADGFFGTRLQGYDGGGAGGGAGGALAMGAGRAAAPPVEGLISLAPPLVEQGRSFAFRKLDASAEIRIDARMPGLGRRAAAAGAWVVALAAVWALRRRFRRI